MTTTVSTTHVSTTTASSINASSIHVIDSHTAGEPTRVVTAGFPELTGDTLADKLDDLKTHFDHYRAAIINEPRGSDVLVGALLCDPDNPTSSAGVIFFNNVGYLGMCGHGTIGVVETLAHLGRLSVGQHHLDTPVGTVTVNLHEDGTVSVHNVPSYRRHTAVQVEVPGYGQVTGDVAWGGNWFFLVDVDSLPFQVHINLSRVDSLTSLSEAVRQALRNANITGEDNAEIDHIELCTHTTDVDADAQNFVLCPGTAYDRSPCGTGTSAKLACLAADGKLAEGVRWRQASIIGSMFEGHYELICDGGDAGKIRPTIRGRAHITAQSELRLSPEDPFCWGITDANISTGNTALSALSAPSSEASLSSEAAS
ncbi:MAG: proline racemase family protein [Deinococcota bacterium]